MEYRPVLLNGSSRTTITMMYSYVGLTWSSSFAILKILHDAHITELVCMKRLKTYLINSMKEINIPYSLVTGCYAPIILVDVESSFSMYEKILSDNRASFTSANLRKYMKLFKNYVFFYFKDRFFCFRLENAKVHRYRSYFQTHHYNEMYLNKLKNPKKIISMNISMFSKVYVRCIDMSITAIGTKDNLCGLRCRKRIIMSLFAYRFKAICTKSFVDTKPTMICYKIKTEYAVVYSKIWSTKKIRSLVCVLFIQIISSYSYHSPKYKLIEEWTNNNIFSLCVIINWTENCVKPKFKEDRKQNSLIIGRPKRQILKKQLIDETTVNSQTIGGTQNTKNKGKERSILRQIVQVKRFSSHYSMNYEELKKRHLSSLVFAHRDCLYFIRVSKSLYEAINFYTYKIGNYDKPSRMTSATNNYIL
ncbi:hypothetical protein AGLY_003198 [Aphis glycines]|uniref:Uncharacterized protein n=1 Tax=Aphis glycines TaxID=307491 RepID=A0A6G0U2V3_APHGL|nr:hypothetical protein AGLY_003198 [Aphis glycines]